MVARVREDPTLGDVSLENVQARLRTLVLMTLANLECGLVVGTGDLSEKALGWSTYAGDHIAMYDVNAGIPKTLVISDEEIREALQETFSTIVESVKIALERTPPELAADIVDKGVVVAGGGSLIKGLDILLRESTGLPITLAEDPLSAVALGAGKLLSDPKLLKKVVINLSFIDVK